MPCRDCYRRTETNKVLKSAQELDEWVGVQPIRHLTAGPKRAAAFARYLFELRASLRALRRLDG